jgi:hypothetical protein
LNTVKSNCQKTTVNGSQSTAYLIELQALFSEWELQSEAKVGLLHALALKLKFGTKSHPVGDGYDRAHTYIGPT